MTVARTHHFITSIRRLVIVWLWLSLPCLLASCGDESAKAANPGARDPKSALAQQSVLGQSAAAPAIAVSNSWLECCLRDLEGGGTKIRDVNASGARNSNGVEIYSKGGVGDSKAAVSESKSGASELNAAAMPLARICPPGTCPGHFDIRPAAAAELRECRWAFIFNFQQSMTEKLLALSSDRMTIFAIPAPQGLCVPASYLTGCESVREALSKARPEKRKDYDMAMEGVRARIAALEKELIGRVRGAGLSGVKVAASGHQSRFCQWLGLDPSAVYSGSEVSSPAQIEEMLEKGKSSGVRMVIANQQESAQAGEAIARRLGVPVVVFSNFPSMNEKENTFDALVRANVGRLLEAMKNEAAKSEAMKIEAARSETARIEAVKSTAAKSEK